MTQALEHEPIPTLHCSCQAADDDAYQVSRIDGVGSTKAYVCVRPQPGGTIEAQAEQVYVRLDRVLDELGARRQDVVSEKVFFHDMADEFDALQTRRGAYYDFDQHGGPATVYLQQPPCRAGTLIELQARVIFASQPHHEVRIQSLDVDLGAGVARLVSYRGYDHLYVHNITGGEAGDGLDYAAQTKSVFERAEKLLESLGLSFRDVVRTWIYLRDMEGDYDDLNRVRSAFFQQVGVQRLPASTGIQGGVYPPCRAGSMDLYALRTDKPTHMKLMHTATLNEAHTYGSRFARGMEVTREDRKVLYVSGTASIDDQGQVVAVGDIEGQIHRMLANVESLLASSGADPRDLVRATTYLKDAADYQVFGRIWRERGYPDNIPHTICQADVCRPDWLCEIEVVAILPLAEPA